MLVLKRTMPSGAKSFNLTFTKASLLIRVRNQKYYFYLSTKNKIVWVIKELSYV